MRMVSRRIFSRVNAGTNIIFKNKELITKGSLFHFYCDTMIYIIVTDSSMYTLIQHLFYHLKIFNEKS